MAKPVLGKQIKLFVKSMDLFILWCWGYVHIMYVYCLATTELSPLAYFI